MNVGRRMSFPVITVSPDVSVPDALAKMHREKIRYLLVVEKNKLVGIVTRNDLLNASPSSATTLSVWEINYLLNKIKVADVMTKQVITVTEDTPIEEAARVMNDNEISCLPVMRGKDVAGIITESDLFEVFLELMGAHHRGVRLTAEVSDTPGVLAGVAQAIYNAGGNIIALGAFSGETINESMMTIKVEGISEETLKQLLSSHVIRLVDIRTL